MLHYVGFAVHIGHTHRRVEALIHEGTNLSFTVPGLTSAANHLKNNYDCKLADNYDNDNVNNIHLMLGAEYFHEFAEEFTRVDDLNLLRTAAGYSVVGKIPQHYITKNKTRGSQPTQLSFQSISINRLNIESDPLEQQLKNLWQLDTIGIVPEKFTTFEQKAITQFHETVKYNNNKYEVQFPFKPESLPGRNETTAYATLMSLNNKFKTDASLHTAYCNILDNYFENDFIEEVPNDEIPNTAYYLPHHCVKKESKTTPIRIVFNASSKTNSHNSLNDCVFAGPSLTTKLFNLVLHFRTKSYILSSDISKAFLRVGLQANHRDYTRFFFNFNIHNSKDVSHLRFKVIPFGINCSPFLLSQTLKYHCEKSTNEFIQTLDQYFYVDNLILPVDSKTDLEKYYRVVTDTLASANMPMSQWVTNDQSFNHLHSDD
ncbi:MAG: reverse transcriptase domain-containing protein, partial [Cyanobacteria bacterium J06582_2]